MTATTAIEKVMGVFGIFLSFLVALPFGIKIFGENGPMVAAITVPISLGLIGALLAVLWFPGLVQWLLLRLPIPGKARLEGVVLRVAHSASAYRDKKLLVLLALGALVRRPLHDGGDVLLHRASRPARRTPSSGRSCSARRSRSSRPW